MAENTAKSVNDVALDNYDELVQAVANVINDIVRKLISHGIISIDNKQLISNQGTDILKAECLLDKFIFNRVGSGEDGVFFTFLKILTETRKCNSVVKKIYNDLGKPIPNLLELPVGADDGEFEMDPKVSRLIVGIVLPRVSAYWDTIAAFLEYPIAKTREIDRHCRGDPKDCCKMLLEDWFTSHNGVKPKTWDKLVEVLSEISDIAASTLQIKRLLREEGVI